MTLIARRIYSFLRSRRLHQAACPLFRIATLERVDIIEKVGARDKFTRSCASSRNLLITINLAPLQILASSLSGSEADSSPETGPSAVFLRIILAPLHNAHEHNENEQGQDSGAFYRQGLAVGMKLEKTLGHNPYKMGAVAGADVHSGYQGNEEWDWKGAHGAQDDTPQKRLNPVSNASGEPGYVVSSAGTTAVWAEENTREGIWNGMMSKETYGTSGTLIRLRFFGGWGMPAKLTSDRDFVKTAYAAGVPMGRDMPPHPAKDLAKAPSFAVWAMKDPESGNLDRVQIIKVWSGPRNGYPKEKIYDVAWSDADKRKPDPKTGKLPPVGNTVDIKKATLHQRHRRYTAVSGLDRSRLRYGRIRTSIRSTTPSTTHA